MAVSIENVLKGDERKCKLRCDVEQSFDKELIRGFLSTALPMKDSKTLFKMSGKEIKMLNNKLTLTH